MAMLNISSEGEAKNNLCEVSNTDAPLGESHVRIARFIRRNT